VTRLRDLDAAWFDRKHTSSYPPDRHTVLDLLEHAVTALRDVKSMPNTHDLLTNAMARAMYEVITAHLDAQIGGDRA